MKNPIEQNMKKTNRREFLEISAKVIAGASLATGLNLSSNNQVQAQTNNLVNPITIENSKQGTTAWEIFNPALNGEIAGYASKMGVKKGSTINFYASTPETIFYAAIYRLGWYGGAGGREYRWAETYVGRRQNVSAPNSKTGLVNCNWSKFETLTVPTDWTNGLYVMKLTADQSGAETYIPFVVYDERPADYLFQIPFTTWQAYNNFGGKSLYDFNSTNNRRAYKVSFNRPYAQGWGAGYLIAWEICMLRFLEREGFDVNYCSDYEIHTNSNLLLLYKTFIVAGHDEYWTRQMRVNVESALSRRINLAFFAANCAFWQVRFESSSNTTNPIMTCYKSASLDPYYRNTANRPYTTVLFKDPIVNLPEGKLMGVEYQDYDAAGDIVIERPDHWVFAGTGATVGTRLPGLVGVEYDRITSNSPSNIVRLAHSPTTGVELGAGFSDMTIYTHSSGASVFSAGTIVWPNGLDNYNTKFALPDLVNPMAQQITRNVLNRFAGR